MFLFCSGRVKGVSCDWLFPLAGTSRAPCLEGGWCGRPESNRHRPFGPTDFHTTSAFAATLRCSWSGLSLHQGGCRRCCPSSLYTFPLAGGLARDCQLRGFPEFEQFCIPGFPRGHSIYRLSPLRLPVSPRPLTGAFITRPDSVAKVQALHEDRPALRLTASSLEARARMLPAPSERDSGTRTQRLRHGSIRES
jgi:hypothetical protein